MTNQLWFDCWQKEVFLFSKSSHWLTGPYNHVSNRYWEEGLSLSVAKWLGSEANHLPPSSAKVQNVWRYISFCLYIMVFKGATIASFRLHNFIVYTAALSYLKLVLFVCHRLSMLVTMMAPVKCEQPPLECSSNEDNSRSSVDETNNNNGDVELTSLNWLHNLNIIPSLLPTPPSSPTPSQSVKPQVPARIKHGA